MAGRVSVPGGKQRIFMRLATLELERVRRETEYQVASQRAQIAFERVHKLQAEIDQMILDSMKQTTNSAPSAARPVVRAVTPGQAQPLRYGARRS